MSDAPRFPFSAVIFDMDGVLVDSEYFYAMEILDLSREFGMGLTREDVFSQAGASHQQFRRNLVAWFGRAGRVYTEDEAEAAYGAWAQDRRIDFASVLNPGVPETVSELRARGVRVALASSSPLENIERALAECGLTGAFEVIVSGEQFRESKPDPEIYLHTVELLGLPARECCCVEDSIPGITAGKAAGLTVIAKREERFGYTQDAADLIIDQIPDLLGITA